MLTVCYFTYQKMKKNIEFWKEMHGMTNKTSEGARKNINDRLILLGYVYGE